MDKVGDKVTQTEGIKRVCDGVCVGIAVQETATPQGIRTVRANQGW